MQITKYEHSCLDIKVGNSRIIIDPGKFTKKLTDFSDIDAVVITHVHGDHLDPSKLDKIIENNPDVNIYTTKEASKEIKSNAKNVKNGQEVKVGDFNLSFYGEMHSEIDPQTPLVENIGVLVNNTLYYPGDSFTECPKNFKVLAIPTSAPWLRVGQTIPLIENSQCDMVFPTHNALLSEIGHQTTNTWLQKFTERSGKQFKFIKPGESVEA